MFHRSIYRILIDMILFPNAKINIGLNIISKRTDGYHDIETIMYPVPWCDILEIVPATGTRTTLTVTGRDVACPPEKNLVMKAYHMLDRRIPLPPVDIFLHKIVPDGAGLGGGSADAAFTLLALNSLFNLDLDKEHLAEIASGIGADCPFFIYNVPMIATGTGTTLAPVDFSLKGYRIALVKPAVSVPTAEAYAGVTPGLPEIALADYAAKSPREWTGKIANGFEISVFNRYPEIAAIKESLTALGAIYAAMSGSGSSVYGIFPIECDNLAESLKNTFSGCDIFTALLS